MGWARVVISDIHKALIAASKELARLDRMKKVLDTTERKPWRRTWRFTPWWHFVRRPLRCPICLGRGAITVLVQGRFVQWRQCWACDSHGYIGLGERMLLLWRGF